MIIKSQRHKIDNTHKENDLYFVGQFWIVTDSITELIQDKGLLLADKTICDFNGNRPNTNIHVLTSIHNQSWVRVKEQCALNLCDKNYNYYPRGRVEVHNGTCFIYTPKGAVVT